MNARVRLVMACLAVDSRLRLVSALAEADRCVSELAAAVGLSQSCTTRHLQALSHAGLVRGRREGKRVSFRLCREAPGTGELLLWLLSGAEGVSRAPQGGAPDAPCVSVRSADGSSLAEDRPTGRERGRARRQAPSPRGRIRSTPRPDSATISREGDSQGAGAGPAPGRRMGGDLEDFLL